MEREVSLFTTSMYTHTNITPTSSDQPHQPTLLWQCNFYFGWLRAGAATVRAATVWPASLQEISKIKQNSKATLEFNVFFGVSPV